MRLVGRKLKSLEVFFWFCFQKITRGNPPPPLQCLVATVYYSLVSPGTNH